MGLMDNGVNPATPVIMQYVFSVNQEDIVYSPAGVLRGGGVVLCLKHSFVKPKARVRFPHEYNVLRQFMFYPAVILLDHC